MRPLGHKEKNDLFFQYLVAFVLTAGLLLGALFLPQGDSNIVINDVDKELFKEFDNFKNSKAPLSKLIDTVQSEAKGIINQNAGGSSANRASKDLIDDFNNSNSASPFVRSITDLLSLYVNATSELKSNQDNIVEVKRKLEGCISQLDTKQLFQQMNNNKTTDPSGSAATSVVK